MKLLACVLIVVLCSTIANSSAGSAIRLVTGALEILMLGKDITTSIMEIWSAVNYSKNMPLETRERSVTDRVSNAVHNLQDMSDKYDAIGAPSMATMIKNFPQVLKFELKLNDLSNAIDSIDVQYAYMKEYVNSSNFQTSTLDNYASAIISHELNSVKNLVDKIFLYFIPSDTAHGLLDNSLLNGLVNNLKEKDGGMLCNFQQSPQQILMNLYSSIAITELKGYSMVQYAYMLLTIHGKKNYTEESSLMHKKYEKRSMMSIKALQRAMKETSKDLWRCDPKKHVKGVTYEEITELLQGYLQNEGDLNYDGTCFGSCEDYTLTKSYTCYDEKVCKKHRNCEGSILDCRFHDSYLKVCPSDPQTHRRYEYIEDQNGKVLGRKQSCARGLTSVDSWWRWIFWHCSYCLCLCDDPGRNSDRYFNLKPYMADIKYNRVVTGLRFKKLNRIIHLQIQEGKLMPKGVIDPKTVRWVPLHDYKITDKDIYNEHDYYTLRWFNRAINLDDLIVADKHVVTGVRFKLIQSRINLEVYATPFDFTTGELIDPELKSYRKDYNKKTDFSKSSEYEKPRRKIDLDNVDVPTNSLDPSIPFSKSNMYLEFVNTGFDVDVAQTTVPFIDTQDVQSRISVPLSGAGIYHKGRAGFGGFIAPKIITYDYSRHLQAYKNNLDV